jgi:acyl carrier protein
MAATLSSRTPEGIPNRCPVCRAEVYIEPSQLAGDAPCPGCGTLLWFVDTSSGTVFYEAEAVAPIREKVYAVINRILGVKRRPLSDSASFFEDIGANSLDVVELVMELEEEFEFTIPDDLAEQIKTVGDVIHFIVEHGRKKGSP